MTEIREFDPVMTPEQLELREVHGDGLCHICGMLKRGPGNEYCSYPHGRLPAKDLGNGMSTWEFPTVSRSNF